MSESNPRVAIIIAIVGVVGTLGAALIANWDKIFLSSRELPAKVDSPQPARAQPAAEPASNATSPGSAAHPAKTDAKTEAQAPAPAETTLNTTGTWRDVGFPANIAQVTQNGSRFQFTKQGILPTGVGFQSSGGGTVVGQTYTSSYTATYQGGATSKGTCSGTVSMDGTRVETVCSDSLLGTFPVVSVRQ